LANSKKKFRLIKKGLIMNEDNLNMEIRKFLKKVGISSQRLIENGIYKANNEKLINLGEEIDIEMKLSIKSIQLENIISGKIKIE
tara:strand:+ start:2545 stop:2799 length:255 start_codon:yes stop_codon:yes gene_type:complete